MKSYILGFHEIDKTKLMMVGGKGSNLGELSRIEGIRVPEGFCISTDAYKEIVGQTPEFNTLLDELSLLSVNDRERINEITARIRRVIEGIKIANDIEQEIIHYLSEFGEGNDYAVRSSATAEDLPLSSFAGQQDTYLNITGKDAILHHISKCWASLFTERAVIYRIQNGFDHRKVYLSVIIQRMVFPEVSGIMFTADPVTSNRRVLSIDASFGLGEALVAGIVNPDIYKVRDGIIIDKRIAHKKLAVYALKDGGTEQREIDPEEQNLQTLTNDQITQLETIGRRIEEHFGCPQDIEWCLSEDEFYIVQSRAITTLYPTPINDAKNRVYISVGHQQMMTEAIKPLGMSFLGFFGDVPMVKASGRLFLDVTYDLSSSVGRKILLNGIGRSDPKVKNAILSLSERKDFMKMLPKGKRSPLPAANLSWIRQAIKIYRKNDIGIVQNLITYNESIIQDMQQKIGKLSGDELFEFILQDQEELKKAAYDPQGLAAIVIGILISSRLNKNMEKWLGDKSAADTLSKSVSYNITSQMGLDLMDLSDEVRKYSEVIEYFDHASNETFFEDLERLEGGYDVSTSMRAYLEKYGMRCSGEIDITKSRWSEKPTTLISMILNNLKNFEPNLSTVLFERGLAEAEEKKRDLIGRLERLPGGKQKAEKTEKMISVLRNFLGYREYPKYFWVKRLRIYKQALMREASKLVKKGIIQEKEDIYYLSFEELREVVGTDKLDYSIIIKRKEEYEVYEKLTPPRVMTSEGEVISGEYSKGNIPKGALAGTPVSSGIVEGRARVLLTLEDVKIEQDDILVTAFTDPGWTPLFVSVQGLITEVGGLMTHGAVIAREYGLPAVVGVDNATKLIKDGQRIRVNGTEGYVEILE